MLPAIRHVSNKKRDFEREWTCRRGSLVGGTSPLNGYKKAAELGEMERKIEISVCS